MSVCFTRDVASVCREMPALEHAILAGYSAIMESDAIMEDDANLSSDEESDDTVTMDLDSVAKNMDQFQAALQKKKQAADDDKAADEQLVALGNADTDNA